MLNIILTVEECTSFLRVNCARDDAQGTAAHLHKNYGE